jgi:hypothetical protein
MADPRDVRLGIGLFADLLTTGIGVFSAGSTKQTGDALSGGVTSMANRLGGYLEPNSPTSAVDNDPEHSQGSQPVSVLQSGSMVMYAAIAGVVVVVAYVFGKLFKIF